MSTSNSKPSSSETRTNSLLPLEQRLRDLQHFGEEGGVVPTVDVASTSTFLNPDDMDATFRGEREGCYLYSRHSNPTVNIFGLKMAALEGSEAAIGVSSGMAAVYHTLHQLKLNLSPFKPMHVISSSTVYGGTYALFQNVLPKQGIDVDFILMQDEQALERALKPHTRVIYVETLSNPLLRIADLKRLSIFAKKYGLKLVVDNTFAPTLIEPITLGADVVVHSCTKFISGASDMIAGAICGTKEFITSLIDINGGSIMLCGPVMDTRVAHELYLRLDHLPLRMRAHSLIAQMTADRLHQKGYSVIYPGLENHPDYGLFKQLSRGMGAGGVVTLDCGTVEKAKRLAGELQDQKYGLYAVSLGFSRTLMSCPSVSTSSEIPDNVQQEMGLKNSFLRLSIGYTGQDQVMLDRLIKACQKIL
jgi:methionine-gamma-lyase